MASLPQYAVTLALAHSLYKNGSWCGETHLQKAMYFLNEFCKDAVQLDFTLYKHGPYSFDFHDQLGELKNLGFITQEITPPYGPRYKVTARGEWLIQNQDATVLRIRELLSTVVQCIGSKNVKELEKISTALYVWREMPASTVEDRAKRLNAIKPHIDIGDATSTTAFFDETVLPCFRVKACAV